MVRRALAFLAFLGFALIGSSGAAFAQYTETILVADSTNTATTANPPDPFLINAWGLTRGPGLPFWVADNGSGWSTLYSGSGAKVPLNVIVPGAKQGTQGSPTGIVFNGTNDFALGNGDAVFFVFATLDGTISAWSPAFNLHEAKIKVDRSKFGDSFTALAISNNAAHNFLYAADNAHDRVVMISGDYSVIGSFSDHSLPKNLSVFGIRDIGGLLYVSFADINGGPGGVIDIFTEQGKFVKHLTSGSPLNQPWGFAAAPANFGPLSNTLLVSNNIDNAGTINAFNALTGAFVGTVNDANGSPIQIDQLWAIDFGGGDANGINGATNELFFTAGPAGNAEGIFGKIALGQ